MSKAALIVSGSTRRVLAVLALVLLLGPPLEAIGLSATASARATVTPPKLNSEETIFYTATVGGHRVLGRTNAQGRCKAFLGADGAGWLSYPDPKVDGDDWMAATAPNCDHWVLLSTRGGQGANLWLVSADGRKMERLTDDERGVVDADDASPQCLSLSPDGQTLAWVQRGRAWSMDLQRRQPRTLGAETNVRAVAWAPDGEWLGLVAGDSVHKVGPDGEPDLLLSPYGCKQPILLWDPTPKSEQLYFMGGGVRRVDAQRRTSLLQPNAVQPNFLSLFAGGKEAVFLGLAGDGQVEVFRLSLGSGKATMTQVTQGGAKAVWASSQNIYFLRDNRLWRCDADGSKIRPLVMAGVGGVSLGTLPPLTGVCP